MSLPLPIISSNAGSFPEELEKRRRMILGELKDRSLWYIKMRWWIPPAIVVPAVAASYLRIDLALPLIVGVAVFILIYNFVFFRISLKRLEQARPEVWVQRFTYWQVTLDYVAMLLLIHFTGGAGSPLIFFFIFHIIFASMLLPPLSAYGFAGLAAAGMFLLAGAEYLGIIGRHPMFYLHQTIDLTNQPFHMVVELGFFTASVFITAYSTTQIMEMLKRRMIALADLSEAITSLNNRLNALFAMIQAVGSIRNLDKVLDIVSEELAAVINVKGISVKILSDDRKTLRYAAVHGLPEGMVRQKVIEVDKSPLIGRIVEGEPYVTGSLSQKEMFQLDEDFSAGDIQSVLYVPLIAEDKLIGILGAYCSQPEHFREDEIDFCKLAAGLVALALENARAYESIESLIKERSWFMMKVAHNLRAPQAAVLSILEVIKEGHLGELNGQQKEYITRIEKRARTMISMINELLTLTKGRAEKRNLEWGPISAAWLAPRLERTFKEEAAEKGLKFKVSSAPDTPAIMGESDMIEQVLENLISNSIKYTNPGGSVKVAFSRGPNNTVQIEVRDNGIGIPRNQMSLLFTEFFRADNAREVEESGTGLGLAIVKEIVDLHHGKILVESEEGLGTIFVVHLPSGSGKEGQ